MKDKKKNQKRNKRKSIHVNLFNEDVYAEYGVENDILLDDALVDRVQALANTKPISAKLSVTFVAKHNIEIDNAKFKKAYKNSVQNRIDMKNHEIFRCAITGTIFLIFSLILLGVYVYFRPYFSAFWDQFLTIFDWVFLWSAIQVLTIELIQLFIDKAKILKLLKAQLKIVSKK